MFVLRLKFVKAVFLGICGHWRTVNWNVSHMFFRDLKKNIYLDYFCRPTKFCCIKRSWKTRTVDRWTWTSSSTTRRLPNLRSSSTCVKSRGVTGCRRALTASCRRRLNQERRETSCCASTPRNRSLPGEHFRILTAVPVLPCMIAAVKVEENSLGRMYISSSSAKPVPPEPSPEPKSLLFRTSFIARKLVAQRQIVLLYTEIFRISPPPWGPAPSVVDPVHIFCPHTCTLLRKI